MNEPTIAAVCTLIGIALTKLFDFLVTKDKIVESKDISAAKGYEFIIARLDERVKFLETALITVQHEHKECIENHGVLQGQIHQLERQIKELK